MSSKNRNGFTIVEVLLSLAIIAMVLSPIYILQGGSSGMVARSARLYDRVVAAYGMLMENVFVPEPKKDATKKLPGPDTLLTLGTKKISEQSSLKNISGLQINQVMIDWTERRKKKQNIIIAITFKPEEKEV